MTEPPFNAVAAALTLDLKAARRYGQDLLTEKNLLLTQLEILFKRFNIPKEEQAALREQAKQGISDGL